MKAKVLALAIAAMYVPFLLGAEPLTLYPQQIISIYDGDTFFADIPNVHPVFGKNIKIRLIGIDTPEIRSECPTKEQKAAEKAFGLKAKAYLEEQFAKAKVITLAEPKRDMYFRIDADVQLDGVSIGPMMIDAGLAKPYDGTTKEGWCNLQ